MLARVNNAFRRVDTPILVVEIERKGVAVLVRLRYQPKEWYLVYRRLQTMVALCRVCSDCSAGGRRRETRFPPPHGAGFYGLFFSARGSGMQVFPFYFVISLDLGKPTACGGWHRRLCLVHYDM